ncbi:MAG TPA: hypothetical protein VEB70_06790 [Noviherbaspirillum sp.]|nr:hypothetical protein [Noviherbaspirillum sp.]
MKTKLLLSLPFALAALTLTGSAHADWVPQILSSKYVATISHGGGTTTYEEDARTGGPLARIAGDTYIVPQRIESGLNGFMREAASGNGTSFLYGSLTGNLGVTIRPQPDGTALMRLHGMQYDAFTRYSGKKWGIIKFDCTNHLTLAGMSITAQYGTANGSLPSDKIGVDAAPRSSTECDSNLGWMLPIVSNQIINKVEGRINEGVLAGITGGLGVIKSQLVFAPGQDYQSGLQRLIPADRVITLPNGQAFPIGLYVRDNIAYLSANGQMDIRLGKGVRVEPVVGTGEPSRETISGEVLDVTVSAPGMAFHANLKQVVRVGWRWQCSVRDPSRRCSQP